MEEQNPWWNNEVDIKYEQWKSSKIKWKPEIINEISLKPFSLNFLIGPRQVGKTTSLKILVHDLIKKRNPKSIFYFSCDELIDFRELGEVLDSYISAKKSWGIKKSIIILDEITFVEDWFRAIKSRIDKGIFSNDVLIITGSASLELLKEKERFPGRRGHGKDIYFYPLSFSEYCKKIFKINLKQASLNDYKEVLRIMNSNKIFKKKINEALSSYLKSGGFPLSIIDQMSYGNVSYSTIKTYLDWVKGDIVKLKKSERYTKEIISYLLSARLSPISWNSISKNTSINSPHTVQEYVETLSDLFIIKILYLIEPNNKIEYRKNKKVHFIDPFLYRVFSNYTGIKVLEENLIESLAATHLSKVFDTFYYRNKSEVDCVILKKGKQVGFEVKWGPKKIKKLAHIKEIYKLDKETLPLFFATAKTS